jgi:alanyl-tRNA synthetase
VEKLLKSAISTHKTIEFSESNEQVGEILSVESTDFLRSLTLRKTILARLCEEVRNGRLTEVNSLFEPHGFSVNPEFLKNLSGRLRIMRDIEIALNELDDEAFLAEFSATETQLSVKG